MKVAVEIPNNTLPSPSSVNFVEPFVVAIIRLPVSGKPMVVPVASICLM